MGPGVTIYTSTQIHNLPVGAPRLTRALWEAALGDEQAWVMVWRYGAEDARARAGFSAHELFGVDLAEFSAALKAAKLFGVAPKATAAPRRDMGLVVAAHEDNYGRGAESNQQVIWARLGDHNPPWVPRQAWEASCSKAVGAGMRLVTRGVAAREAVRVRRQREAEESARVTRADRRAAPDDSAAAGASAGASGAGGAPTRLQPARLSLRETAAPSRPSGRESPGRPSPPPPPPLPERATAKEILSQLGLPLPKGVDQRVLDARFGDGVGASLADDGGRTKSRDADLLAASKLVEDAVLGVCCAHRRSECSPRCTREDARRQAATSSSRRSLGLESSQRRCDRFRVPDADALKAWRSQQSSQ